MNRDIKPSNILLKVDVPAVKQEVLEQSATGNGGGSSQGFSVYGNTLKRSSQSSEPESSTLIAFSGMRVKRIRVDGYASIERPAREPKWYRSQIERFKTAEPRPIAFANTCNLAPHK